MCISVPGRVISVDGPAALVDVAGAQRRYNALLEANLHPGDWVLVHAGFVLRVLPEAEVREIEETFAELDRLTTAPQDGLRRRNARDVADSKDNTREGDT